MLIKNTKFAMTDWSDVPARAKDSEFGSVASQTVQSGNARVRIVEYSPGYHSDQWCERGHVVYVLEGELVTELKDGRIFTMKAGMGYHVGDQAEPHRSRTVIGAKIFVVD